MCNSIFDVMIYEICILCNVGITTYHRLTFEGSLLAVKFDALSVIQL